MPIFLYAVGILVGVIGLLTIGFSIPVRVREIGLADTLIVAGATSIIGGLLLIGLGIVAREVRRLAKALERPTQRPADPAAAARATGRAPLPTPTPPVPARGRAEPRLDVPPSAEPAPAPAAVRQRPDILAAIRGAKEPPVVETEAAPLSPLLPPRVLPPGTRPEPAEAAAAAPRAVDRATDRAAEPAPPPPGPRPPSPAALASRAAARLDLPRPVPDLPRNPQTLEPRPAPERSERPGRNLFDTVWPTEPRRPGESGPEPGAERVSSERLFREPIMPEDRGAPERSMPDGMPDPDHARPAEDLRATSEPPRNANEPRPVAILKSGVIDGMAYTLYTDGSIEAQLPKGLMRFASIDDLRSYLERNGSH